MKNKNKPNQRCNETLGKKKNTPSTTMSDKIERSTTVMKTRSTHKKRFQVCLLRLNGLEKVFWKEYNI